MLCERGRKGARKKNTEGVGRRGGQGKPRGRGTRGTSPAASNRKGKTPGERELVFGDIAVTGRRHRRRRKQRRRQQITRGAGGEGKKILSPKMRLLTEAEEY